MMTREALECEAKGTAVVTQSWVRIPCDNAMIRIAKVDQWAQPCMDPMTFKVAWYLSRLRMVTDRGLSNRLSK